MSLDELDAAPAALLRYLHDSRRTGIGLRRLLDMGMITAPELAQLVAELERKGLVSKGTSHQASDAYITKTGVAWVRSHFDDAQLS